MAESKQKPWCQVFTCHKCGEPQFIFGLADLRELGVKVNIIDGVAEPETDDKEKMN
jgi:hypothetical protein